MKGTSINPSVGCKRDSLFKCEKRQHVLYFADLVFDPDRSLVGNVPLRLSRRSHRLSLRLRLTRAHHLLSRDCQQLVDSTVSPVRTTMLMLSFVVSAVQTTTPLSPAPGTTEPSNCVYIKMKPPTAAYPPGVLSPL